MSRIDKVHRLVEKGKEDGLLKLAEDRDMEVRLAAIEGLGKVATEVGVNQLITMLHDATPAVRAASASSLGRLGDTRAATHLAHALDIETDPQAKQSIQDALSALSSHH